MKKMLFLVAASFFALALFSCNDEVGEVDLENADYPAEPTTVEASAVAPTNPKFDASHVKGIRIYQIGGMQQGKITFYSYDVIGEKEDGVVYFEDLPLEEFSGGGGWAHKNGKVAIGAGGYPIEWYRRSTRSYLGSPVTFWFDRNVDFTNLKVTFTFSVNSKDIDVDGWARQNWAGFQVYLVDKDGEENAPGWANKGNYGDNYAVLPYGF